MSKNKQLTQKQRYLQFLIPMLDDALAEKLIAVVAGKDNGKDAGEDAGKDSEKDTGEDAGKDTEKDTGKDAGKDNTIHAPVDPDGAVNEENKPTPPSAAKGSAAGRKPEPQEEDPYRDLMNMIGCEEAKQQLTAMIADFRMRKLAEARGRNSARAYYHAVFIGNPGCAKTTCARLYAKVLAREGITQTNYFAELSRSKIVDKYVGSTAMNVRKIFDRNVGGVIFVDEAYSLCDGDPGSKNNFGTEAINELIVCMENHPETVVIFAGYPDKMEEFLASNPGLRSRIPYTVAFSDYTTDELVDISRVIAREQGYEIAESAMDKLCAIYDNAKHQKDFGNGRYARNVVEAAVRVKALRLGVMEKQMDDLMDQTRYTDSMLFSLDESCFAPLPEPPEQECRKIGFSA